MTQTIEKRYFTAGEVRVAKAEGEPAKITGHAAVFNKVIDLGYGLREQVAPGAFKSAIEENHDVRALVDHDPSKILGRTAAGTLTLSEDETGLYVEIVPPDTQLARDLQVSLGRGDITGMSFGFIVTKESWEHDNEGDLRTIEDVELFDVSVVTYPAYPDTDVSVAKRSHQAWQQAQEIPSNANARARVQLARRK